MINRKLCVVVCCLGVGFAHVARAQSSGGDDQSKALDALRQAEKGPAKTQAAPAATPTPAPAPASSDADNAQALDALRQAEKGGPAAAPANAAPAAAPSAAPVAAAPASPEDEARALEALHSAEQSQQTKPTDTAAAARAKKDAEKEALRQKKAAEQEARQKQADEMAAAQAQQAADQKALKQKADEDAEQLRQEQAAKKAAARAKMAEAKQQPVPAQYTANVSKPDDADTASARAALEQFEANGGAAPENPERQSEVNALRRQKAQEEAAWRVEALQKQIKAQPASAAPAVAGPPAGSKEAKLADLLRRYNADEITPFEYHTERAKIIAEP
ncbi:MAG TPA: hypothetical protein VGO67_04560 [Verrucomicrobiae bacterium]|jgi:hypothetical protein